MDEQNEPTTLASGMAQRSFWIGLIGGVFSYACRTESLGRPTQGVLFLLAILLLIISAVFGLIAVIRVTSVDAGRVLPHGLSGLVLSVVFTLLLAHWASEDFRKARLQSMGQAEPTPEQQSPASPVETVVVRPLPVAAPAVSRMKYEFPDLTNIPPAVERARADAAAATGEDAAVLRAWATHLDKFASGYSNVVAAGKALYRVDLLNTYWVTDLTEAEGIRRRGLANDYSIAWHDLDAALFRFQSTYSADLLAEKVSS